MEKEVATSLMMTLGAQTDFHYQLIGILISITKALPNESQPSIAKSIIDLIEEHKESLADMSALHSALHKESTDGK